MITIVYDNDDPVRKDAPAGLTPAWGFACIIEGLEKTILFDTGGDGRTLLENMRLLGFSPDKIDAIVISHVHGDHTGGLLSFLRKRKGALPVYIPTGFPDAFIEEIQSLGGEVIEASESTKVCPNALTTGTLGRGAIEEEGLCIGTSYGWVLITGCAHPGVDRLLDKAIEATGGSVYMVMGGFHMRADSESRINSVIEHFVQAGVRRVAPTHCTGEKAKGLFSQRFGQGYANFGLGSVEPLEIAR